MGDRKLWETWRDFQLDIPREKLLTEDNDDEEIVAQIEDDAKLIIKNIKDMNKSIKKGKKVPWGNIKNIRGLLDNIKSLTEIL